MALRNFNRSLLHYQRLVTRPIMTSSWNSAKAQEDLEKNPYFDKYAEKIKELQKNNTGEYLSRLKSADDRRTSEKSNDEKAAESRVEYPAPKKSEKGTFQRRKLKDIMNLDLLEARTPKEISEIWKEHYSKKEDVIYGSLSKNEFAAFVGYCRRYPVFVVPLPRGDGFEFFMVLFRDDEFHVTPLILYQKYKEDSPESLCVSYFNDLEQDVVLVLGEYDKKVISPIEAQCLVNSLQLFYNSKERLKLVIQFNEHPELFDYNELLKEINSLSLQKQ